MGSFDWDGMDESKMRAYSTVGMRAGIAAGGAVGIVLGLIAVFVIFILSQIDVIPLIFFFAGGTIGFIIGAVVGGLLGAVVDKAIDHKKGI